MAVRPPKSLSGPANPRRPGAADDPFGPTLEQDILAETFATYTRLVEKLERALASLKAETPATPQHGARFAAAAEALTHVVVQRELMRLHGTEGFLAELGVPPELSAGVLPPRLARRRR